MIKPTTNKMTTPTTNKNTVPTLPSNLMEARTTPTIYSVRSSPNSSKWLKDALASALTRDLAEAAKDANTLSVLLTHQLYQTP